MINVRAANLALPLVRQHVAWNFSKFNWVLERLSISFSTAPHWFYSTANCNTYRCTKWSTRDVAETIHKLQRDQKLLRQLVPTVFFFKLLTWWQIFGKSLEGNDNSSGVTGKRDGYPTGQSNKALIIRN